jgi:hypothetical protein
MGGALFSRRIGLLGFPNPPLATAAFPDSSAPVRASTLVSPLDEHVLVEVLPLACLLTSL